MARKSRRSRSSPRHVSAHRARDIRYIANPRLSRWPSLSALPSYEDRRVFSPDKFTLRSFSSSPHRLVAPSRPFKLPSSIFAAKPRQLFYCVRKKIRREVLFAKAGAGRRRMRRPSHQPDIRC